MKLLTKNPQHMRLDARVYHPFNLEAKVLLNGVEQKMVIVADESEGFIVKYATDSSGKLVKDQCTLECQAILKETLYGTVQILHPWRNDKRRAYNK